MKRFLIIAILVLSVVSANAKIHLAAEAGFGNTGIKPGYNTSSSGMYGIMVGKEFKSILIDIGVRSWSCNYTALKDFDLNGLSSSAFFDGQIVNISVPISAGIYLPIGKVNILAKAVLAPTFLTQHHEKAEPSSSFFPGVVLEDYSKRYYTAAGLDIGLGYSFSKRISLDAKYSLLGYLSDLKHDPILISSTPVIIGEGERPKINAFSLQLNLFL
ncbi:MAG: hypothetical protein EOP51_11650 [Sphingobacteriales bacterium]|nr:MAG: hypothetical protein EOP51_11650 [Sphingobacteriales bacterium]